MRGVLRIVSAFAAFLLGGLLARPLGPLFAPLVRGSTIVPRGVQALAADVAAGLSVYVVAAALMSLLIGRREKRRKERDEIPRSRAERLAGAAVGAVWGGLLTLLVLVGISAVARVDDAARHSREDQPIRGATAATAAPASAPIAPGAHPPQSPSPVRRPEELPPLSRELEAMSRGIDGSVFSPVVDRLNPVDARRQAMIRDLYTVIADPVLLQRFGAHPDITRLTRRPELVALARDPEILAMIDREDIVGFLDHPSAAAVLENKDLIAAVMQLDVEAILAGVLAEREAAPRPAPPR